MRCSLVNHPLLGTHLMGDVSQASTETIFPAVLARPHRLGFSIGINLLQLRLQQMADPKWDTNGVSHRIAWVKIALRHPISSTEADILSGNPKSATRNAQEAIGSGSSAVHGLVSVYFEPCHPCMYGDEKSWSLDVQEGAELQSHCFQRLSLRPTGTYNPTFHKQSICFPQLG